jgi:hypothetical protein
MAQRSRSTATAKIPDQMVDKLERRLQAHAQAKWPACKAVSVRSRGSFAYVEAQGEQDEQPEPLCRLRYLGHIDSWEFAYFTWSRETYEASVLDSGLPFGTPEECFDAAAFPMFAVR